MEGLTNLVGTLASLKKVSNVILKNMLPIMEEIAQEGSDIVDEVASRTEADENDVIEYLQSTTLNIITDAETVRKEIEKFAVAAGEGKSAIEASISTYPFLANIWYGDYFDGTEGVAAFQLLLKDLQTEESKTNEDWIIENAVSHFGSVKT